MSAIPRPQAPLADAGGYPSREWYTYWQGLSLASTGGGWEASFKGLAERVTTLETTAPKALIGMQSIKINGIYAQLDGDIDLPGPTWYYGSGPDSVRGWYPLADTLAVTEDLTKAVDDETGVATFGLAGLPDTGIGAALVKITRDGKGRVAGTEGATTDDLNEGAGNLYFTAARAQDALQDTVDDLQGQIDERLTYTSLKSTLVAGANTTLTPDDTAETITITGSGGVSTVTGGTGISVDNTDSENPVVALSSTAQDGLALANTAVQPGDLADVATSGAYADLTGTPTLGTAAAADAGDFATAAQGTLADSAVQPGDLAAVATTGSYSDLSGTPTLGTAAAADTGDFDAVGAATSAVSAHVAASDPHPQYALETDLGGMASIDDAPSDGKTYGRKDGDWAEVTASAISLSLPFWLSNGTESDILLTSNYELPFWLTDGAQSNIAMVS